ncbi:XrtA system polysaccharide chain length determinant [Paracraurococcus ruber]|uniref:Exosortase n=1 Tax=Paracraurococcus ruber TaxID=77675 RepID=A0ABS1CSW2_9PROT|nr:XrtA system polysaccharide chain length determinant [Paracraurococcus ruber]MBK1657570.1 exosortase [Paracraurococcus ruber]TDG32088.1 hypothetical protein E2C05_08660 [Paracraurococcus ruber]
MQILGEIRRYAAAGWQHRWKALILAWIICLGGWAWVHSLPNQYRSSTRIYADADAILGQLLRNLAVDPAPANQVELLARTLLSRPNLERIAARTGLDLRANSATSRDRMLEQLGRDIKIGAQSRNLFTFSYTDPNARMARDVVQALLTLFMEQATANDRQQMENARNFVNQQIAAYETQLREAEQRRAEFRTRYLDLLPNDAAGGLSKLEQSRARLQSLRGDLTDATARRDALRQQLEQTPATLTEAAVGGGGGGGDPRILEAQQQLRELQLTYTDQHPAVMAAQRRLAELRASPLPSAGRPTAAAPGRPAGTGRSNPLHEQIRTRLLDTESSVASLDRQVREEQVSVERLEALARSVPQLQAQFQNLDRDYSVLRKSYEELLERRESVQIAGAARSGAERVRLEVVDPPIMPTEPVGPNRLLFSSMVLAAGLGAGALVAFLLVQLDRGFYTVHDLRKLGLPVIGSISSTIPAKGQGTAAAVFVSSLALLFVAYGAVTAGFPALRSLVSRFVA